MNDLYLGDCREVRSVLADNSVDTIITDPPYGLEFMGKGWDKGVPGVEFWREFLAVAKPGAMLLAFGGTRTFHRMACAIEDAGWEIRDCMMWLYGSGFPKSLDISKAIDKSKGAERAIVGIKTRPDGTQRPNAANWDTSNNVLSRSKQSEQGYRPKGEKYRNEGTDAIIQETAPATDLARQWSGWGTALKPAWEPIIVAMKPLDGTFAENAERWGVAGVNVGGGRIGTEDRHNQPVGAHVNSMVAYDGKDGQGTDVVGRWPANLLLDEPAAATLDAQTGAAVSRFFYCAKASKSERNAGCEALVAKATHRYGAGIGEGLDPSAPSIDRNFHPTVKPLALMEYLCTLTKTPTGGIVLDPFSGSGTTLLAAKNTGREYIGIEQNAEYFEIIKARLGVAQ